MVHDIEMKKQNQRAILLLDNGENEQAEKVFCNNYRKFPCLITSINYAYFLLDEHYSAKKLLFLGAFLRKKKIKHLLYSNENQTMDNKTKYHVECLKGRYDFEDFRLKKAKMHFEFALRINPASIEAVTLLAWISFLEHDPAESLAYLDKLSALLQLGDHFHDNLEILFENCPFIRFPYYQLRAITLYEAGLTNSAFDLIDAICESTLSSKDALFPMTEIMLVCLQLHRDYWLKPIVEKIKQDTSAYTDNEMNSVIFLLLRESKTREELKFLSRRLWRETSFYSKLFFTVRSLLLNKPRRAFQQVPLSYKDCQFLECPIHDRS